MLGNRQSRIMVPREKKTQDASPGSSSTFSTAGHPAEGEKGEVWGQGTRVKELQKCA